MEHGQVVKCSEISTGQYRDRPLGRGKRIIGASVGVFARFNTDF
jgi:hypothetical protein